MIGRLFLILWVGIWTGMAGADTGSCAPLYRDAYIEYMKAGQNKMPDDVMIYLVHFDHSAGLSIAYDEARPLFAALNTPEEKQTAVLNQLSEKMLNGELCPGAVKLTLEQVTQTLRPALKD